MEKGITLNYLTSLFIAYEEFISQISKIIPVIKVDWNEFKTADELATEIEKEYKKIQIILTVKWYHH